MHQTSWNKLQTFKVVAKSVRLKGKATSTKVSKQEERKSRNIVVSMEKGKKPIKKKKKSLDEINDKSQTNSFKVGMMQGLTRVGMKCSKLLHVCMQTSHFLEKGYMDLNALPELGLSKLSPEKRCSLLETLYDCMQRNNASVGEVFVVSVICSKEFCWLNFGGIFLNAYCRFCVLIDNFSELEVARITGIYGKRKENNTNSIGSLEVLNLQQVLGRHYKFFCVSETLLRKVCQNKQSLSNKTTAEDSLMHFFVAADFLAPSTVPLQFSVGVLKGDLERDGQEDDIKHAVVLSLGIPESPFNEEFASNSINTYGLDITSCIKRLTCERLQTSLQDKVVTVNKVEIHPICGNSKEFCDSMEGISSFQCHLFHMKELNKTLNYPHMPFLTDSDSQSDCFSLSILNLLSVFIASTVLYIVAKVM